MAVLVSLFISESLEKLWKCHKAICAKKRPRLGEVRVAESAGEEEWPVYKNVKLCTGEISRKLFNHKTQMRKLLVTLFEKVTTPRKTQPNESVAWASSSSLLSPGANSME